MRIRLNQGALPALTLALLLFSSIGFSAQAQVEVDMSVLKSDQQTAGDTSLPPLYLPTYIEADEVQTTETADNEVEAEVEDENKNKAYMPLLLSAPFTQEEQPLQHNKPDMAVLDEEKLTEEDIIEIAAPSLPSAPLPSVKPSHMQDRETATTVSQIEPAAGTSERLDPDTVFILPPVPVTPPLPPKRPLIQTASTDFVNKARKKYNEEPLIKAKKDTSISKAKAKAAKPYEVKPSGPKPYMTAAPSLPVQIEALPSDEFSRNASAADKQTLMAAISAVNRYEEDDVLLPVPSDEPGKMSVGPVSLPVVPLHKPYRTVRSESEKSLEQYAIVFAPEMIDLVPEAGAALQDTILRRMQDQPSSKLKINAFSGTLDNDTSEARKRSLARALSVRSWLLDHGVAPQRIDIHAMGSKTNIVPADRVELIVVRD